MTRFFVRNFKKASLLGAMALLFGASILNAGAARADDRVIAGPAAAPVTIEEYADLECGFCAKASAPIKRILTDYAGQVKLVFRNLPLAHPGALTSAKAEAAVSLRRPDLAFAFEDSLFANQYRLVHEGESFLYETAENLGVDVSRMKVDMQGPEVMASLDRDHKLAEAHGFRGTPSFMISSGSSSMPIVGARPYDDYKKLVDRALGH